MALVNPWELWLEKTVPGTSGKDASDGFAVVKSSWGVSLQN